jgi:hypothetical protein
MLHVHKLHQVGEFSVWGHDLDQVGEIICTVKRNPHIVDGIRILEIGVDVEFVEVELPDISTGHTEIWQGDIVVAESETQLNDVGGVNVFSHDLVIQIGRKFVKATVFDVSKAVHNSREFGVHGDHVVCHGSNLD